MNNDAHRKMHELADSICVNKTDKEHSVNMNEYRKFCTGFYQGVKYELELRGNGVLVPGPQLKGMQEKILKMEETIKFARTSLIEAKIYLCSYPDHHLEEPWADEIDKYFSDAWDDIYSRLQELTESI